MLKKSFKYLIIALGNLAVLTFLLAGWTDNLELTLNQWVRPLEFLKILAASGLSLIAMRILISYFGKKNITNTNSKIKIAVLITFLISSYLYFDYSTRFINNQFINRQIRNQIGYKLHPTTTFAHGTKAANLTNVEYQEIAKMTGFKKLPEEATNIRYAYSYDGFLPDFSFEVIYDLPEKITVDTFSYKNEKGNFSESQTFAIVDNKKKVSYYESAQ